MTLVDLVAAAFLIMPAIDWLAVLALDRFVRHYPHLDTARERRRVALAIAVVTTVFALLGLGRLGHVPVDPQVAAVAILVAIGGLSLVNAAFLWRYRRALFDRTPPPTV